MHIQTTVFAYVSHPEYDPRTLAHTGTMPDAYAKQKSRLPRQTMPTTRCKSYQTYYTKHCTLQKNNSAQC
jgi:hypothetical protein